MWRGCGYINSGTGGRGGCCITPVQSLLLEDLGLAAKCQSEKKRRGLNSTAKRHENVPMRKRTEGWSGCKNIAKAHKRKAIKPTHKWLNIERGRKATQATNLRKIA